MVTVHIIATYRTSFSILIKTGKELFQSVHIPCAVVNINLLHNISSSFQYWCETNRPKQPIGPDVLELICHSNSSITYKDRFIKEERGELQEDLNEGKGNERQITDETKAMQETQELKGLQNTVEVSQTDTGHWWQRRSWRQSERYQRRRWLCNCRSGCDGPEAVPASHSRPRSPPHRWQPARATKCICP